MAAAQGVLEVGVPSQQPAAPGVAEDLAAEKAFPYLEYLAGAGLWVAFACVGAATAARRACGAASPVFHAFLVAAVGAALLAALLLVPLALQVLRATRAMAGLRTSPAGICAKQTRKHSCLMVEELTSWELLRGTTLLGLLALFPFFLLFVVGAAALLFSELLPMEGSQMERIAFALIDVGVLGLTAMLCFIILPSIALKLWRSNYGDDAAQHCDI
ncbi:unnamed protein product [Urochloa decumbens]|uniref:Uncharacterized protein n=1 Tax=Urochloa decumbens TaxID=240449 RepID=A0ABC9BR41_9POAL